jgi:hypothetical protein
MTFKMCNQIGHNICLDKWIASTLLQDIFPVSHLAKLISSLIILSFKHQNLLGGLDALSVYNKELVWLTLVINKDSISYLD